MTEPPIIDLPANPPPTWWRVLAVGWAAGSIYIMSYFDRPVAALIAIPVLAVTIGLAVLYDRRGWSMD